MAEESVWLVAAAVFLIAVLVHLLRTHRYSFYDKTVLITGGSRGLGFVLAQEFLREGAKVAICARDTEELRLAKFKLQREGGRVLEFTCDVSDEHQVRDMVWHINQIFGPVDVLINNAGIIQVGPMEVMMLRDYQEAMRDHFWGPLYLTLNVLEGMRRQGAGRIVNISSIGGKISVPHMLPYSASKFALVGFSEGLRAELLSRGIKVTTVCPGLMRTGSPRNAEFKGRHREEYAWFSIADSIPILSMNARRAARRIVSAARSGKAGLYLGLAAKLAIPFNGLFPGINSSLLSLMNRLLPKPGGIGMRRAKGSDSVSVMSPSWLTWFNEKAAEENNELVRKVPYEKTRTGSDVSGIEAKDPRSSQRKKGTEDRKRDAH